MKNKKTETLKKNSIQLSNDSNETISNVTSIDENQLHEGKSTYISEIERIFDITFEPEVIICGVDDTVLVFENAFDRYVYFWSPTPKECFQNSTSHIIHYDYSKCASIDPLILLKYYGIEKEIIKSDGTEFSEIDVLISLSKNGQTKYFNIKHQKIQNIFMAVSEKKYFSDDFYMKYVNQQRDYFNYVFSNDPEDLKRWVINFLDKIKK